MRCLVVGSPIAHSLSPAMHRAAYRAAGLDWTYDALQVEEGRLAAVLDGLGDQLRGVSVTAPLKREAAALAAHGSAVVEALGVANTLVRDAAGWVADNTDVPGALAALGEAGIGPIGHVRIIGGGATAAAMAHAVVSAGTEHVEVLVRDRTRADSVVHVVESGGASVTVHHLDDDVRDPTDLLVSTVPVAAVEQRAEALVERAASVFDVVYDPWPTALATAADRRDVPVVSGLDLLAHQAVLQLKQMADLDVAVDLLRDAARDALMA